MKNILTQNTAPPILNAEELASYLHISRAGAYQLLNRRDFPTLQVGKRKLVPYDKLVRWINEQTGDGERCGRAT